MAKQPFSRSLINESIRQAMAVFEEFGFSLPPFAFWTPAEWESRGPECDPLRDAMLGWDVTDFGSGCFAQIGRTLFTLRNGRVRSGKPGKPYAEKLILDPEGQRAPLHYHRSKTEDIINRGGGNILVQLRPCGPDGAADEGRMRIESDGVARTVSAGDILRLKPGQSVTIPPRIFHQFWGEEGTGWTVSGEISSVCDDFCDNVFLDPMSRFPAITEDDRPAFLLCHEYPRGSKKSWTPGSDRIYQ